MQVETFPHLSASNSQHLIVEHHGILAMKVHQVLQTPVTPVLAHNDIAVLHRVNHEVSAAVFSADVQRHRREKLKHEHVSANG